MTGEPLPSRLRAYLILARASNLPTVWSNCLAGWLLGGGGDALPFFLLCLGASFLYVGGMFLNDAFDAGFDRQFRPERPIPSGAITLPEVWTLGITFLCMGVTLLFWMGVSTALFSLLLAALILLYDSVHKRTLFAPVLMGSCRSVLYLLAASAGSVNGVDGYVLWCAVVMGAYVAGLSYIARAESQPGLLRYWPCVLLAAPMILSWLVNDGAFQKLGIALSAIYLFWTVWSVRRIFVPSQRDIGAAVSGLLAGIVIVDMLLVAGGGSMALAFALLFAAARAFQKFIPAT